VLPPTWTTGANVTDWSTDGYAHAEDVLEAARADGITSVSLVPTLYMRNPADSTVAADPDLTPSDASLRAAAAEAQALGLSVTIKPHVDVLDGSYRGAIQPADRAAWFASYGAALRHYAALAGEVGATTLVVGTELDSMAPDQAQWLALIADARGAFTGELTYAANWGVADDVPFWGALDEIGVDAYVPLGDAASTPAQLRDAWQPLATELAALHQSTGKPVRFTELGYQSRTDGLRTPFAATGASDEGVQARGYEAAFAVWSKIPWFRGISWWDLPVRPGASSAHDGAFDPRGKAAEDVLRRWTGATGPVPAAPTTDEDGGGPWAVLWGGGLLAVVLVIAAAVVVGWRRRGPAPERVAAPADDPGRPPEDLPAPAEALMDRARSTLDSDSSVLFLCDPHDAAVVHVAMAVGVPQDLVGRRLSNEEGLMGHVLQTGNAISVADRSQLPNAISHPGVSDVSAALSVPVRLDGRVVGALSVGRGEPFAPSERHLLAPVADAIAQLLPPRPVAESGPDDPPPHPARELATAAQD
jgi:hypothetical protein